MIKKSILSFFTIAILLCIDGFAGNEGKIIFSKSPIDVSKGENQPNESSFEVGDKIYCAAFFPKKISSYKRFDKSDYSKHIWVDIKLDGEDWDISDGEPKNFNQDITSFTFLLVSFNDQGYNAKELAEKINKLKTGSYKITVDVMATKWDPLFSGGATPRKAIASGEFKLNKVADSKLLKLGNNFNDIEELPNKLGLKDSALALLRKTLPVSGYDRFDGEVKDCKVTTEWEIQNHEYTGAILGRICNIVAFEKETDGTCRASKYCLKQQYNGKGFDKKLFFEGGRVRTWAIDCE